MDEIAISLAAILNASTVWFEIGGIILVGDYLYSHQIETIMHDNLNKLTFQAFQQSKNYFSLTHKLLSLQLKNLLYPSIKQNSKPVSKNVLLKFQQRLNQILETDWQDMEKGIYPQSLLFDNSWEDFFRYYPLVWLDLPQRWERSRQKKHQDFSPDINTEGYPSYYVQNFHYQSNGYLSDLSANLYDLQVELAFHGGVDIMRRRIIAPLKQGLTNFKHIPSKLIRILDVACGTGRTLKFIRASLPQASLFGIDLSLNYLRKANKLLGQLPGELPQLLQANAEDLPYIDNYFHGVTSAFLFHELPANVRQMVIEQCFRVTKPGGIFIICDAVQLSDSPEFKPLMDIFVENYHEPYYSHYINDDLVERLKKAGFEKIEIQVYLSSKYFIAYKPIR